MMASQHFRREFGMFLDQEIIVELRSGQTIKGILRAYDPDTFSIILEDAVIKNEVYKYMMVNGSTISIIYLKEKKVDLEKLAKKLEETFPNMVEYKRPLGVIIVMNRIRVTEKGVEGEGPAYERVKKIFEEFITGMEK